ncbi:hypothetical protein [Moraxella lacunata]
MKQKNSNQRQKMSVDILLSFIPPLILMTLEIETLIIFQLKTSRVKICIL